jgi:hydroxymethylpyrimidine pyrophosphatase-like HAD family hydrolase
MFTIAVDFDGTIVEHRYPAIGKERTFAFETLKSLQKQGHLLILWTFRSGKELDEAVDYCLQNGLEFHAINCNYPGEKYTDDISRKIIADIYIDDRNIGGFPGWGEIWHMINENRPLEEKNEYDRRYEIATQSTFCRFLKKLFCRSHT